MKKYLVTRVVELSKEIEAESKEEAIEEFGDLNADQRVIRETAKEVKVRPHRIRGRNNVRITPKTPRLR